eukprot:2789549-Prymnesium_polylepis.2
MQHTDELRALQAARKMEVEAIQASANPVVRLLSAGVDLLVGPLPPESTAVVADAAAPRPKDRKSRGQPHSTQIAMWRPKAVNRPAR